MSTTTPRLGLYKPATTGELVNVATDLNGNSDKVDAMAGFRPVTAGTMPGAPAYDGECVHQTDTDRFYVGTGGAWLQIVTEDVAFLDHIRTSRTASSDAVLFSKIPADTQDRYALAVSGLMEWGAGGASARDTNLYRNAANELKTDDSLVVGADLSVTSPRFVELTRAATLAITASSLTDVTWTGENSDARGMFTAPSTTFTVPAGMGGLWGIRAYARFVANAVGVRLMQVLINGTMVVEDRGAANNVASQPHSMQCSIDKLLAAGDTVKIAVFHTSSTSPLNLDTLPLLTLSRYA